MFSYPKIRAVQWVTEREIVELLQILAGESVIVPGQMLVRASRDVADDKFLAAAVEGQAEYIVTGDRDLLALGPTGT